MLWKKRYDSWARIWRGAEDRSVNASRVDMPRVHVQGNSEASDQSLDGDVDMDATAAGDAHGDTQPQPQPNPNADADADADGEEENSFNADGDSPEVGRGGREAEDEEDALFASAPASNATAQSIHPLSRGALDADPDTVVDEEDDLYVTDGNPFRGGRDIYDGRDEEDLSVPASRPICPLPRRARALADLPLPRLGSPTPQPYAQMSSSSSSASSRSSSPSPSHSPDSTATSSTHHSYITQESSRSSIQSDLAHSTKTGAPSSATSTPFREKVSVVLEVVGTFLAEAAGAVRKTRDIFDGRTRCGQQ